MSSNTTNQKEFSKELENIAKKGISKGHGFEIESSDDEERTIVAIGSTEEIDRANESIPLEAWDIENFEKNPVILLHHDPTMPIGRALWIKKVKGKGLVFKIQFHPTQLGEEVYKLYKEGYLNAFSVGFANKAKTKKGSKGERIFQKVELHELSCVAIPCNTGTEVLVKSFNKEINRKEITKQEFKQIVQKFLGDDMSKKKKVKKNQDVTNKEDNAEQKDNKPEEVENKDNDDIITKQEDEKSEEVENKDEKSDKAAPVKGTNGGYSMTKLFYMIFEAAWEEGYYLDDVFPDNYPEGEAVAIDNGNKTFSLKYTINENDEINFESITEVEAVFVQKDIGKKLSIDISKSINNRVEKQILKQEETISELKNLVSLLKKESDKNIIKNEIEKISDENNQDVKEETKKTESETGDKEDNDELKLDIKSYLDSWKDEMAENINSKINGEVSVGKIIDNVIKKNLGKI